MITMLPKLALTIETAKQSPIPGERKQLLHSLVGYIRSRVDIGKVPVLKFICTHNSRRSQFAQVWASVAAAYFEIPCICCSGGTEVTACNPRTIAALERSGFKITPADGKNPAYIIRYAENLEPIQAYSKRFDDPTNDTGPFAAVMTCSDADEACPFVPGAEMRFRVHYKDPGNFDGMPEEAEIYDDTSMQVASEMMFVFDQIRKKQ